MTLPLPVADPDKSGEGSHPHPFDLLKICIFNFDNRNNVDIEQCI